MMLFHLIVDLTPEEVKALADICVEETGNTPDEAEFRVWLCDMVCEDIMALVANQEDDAVEG